MLGSGYELVRSWGQLECYVRSFKLCPNRKCACFVSKGIRARMLCYAEINTATGEVKVKACPYTARTIGSAMLLYESIGKAVDWVHAQQFPVRF